MCVGNIIRSWKGLLELITIDGVKGYVTLSLLSCKKQTLMSLCIGMSAPSLKIPGHDWNISLTPGRLSVYLSVLNLHECADKSE